jgi:hypothetical protein
MAPGTGACAGPGTAVHDHTIAPVAVDGGCRLGFIGEVVDDLVFGLIDELQGGALGSNREERVANGQSS